jgi:hypothetical protein
MTLFQHSVITNIILTYVLIEHLKVLKIILLHFYWRSFANDRGLFVNTQHKIKYLFAFGSIQVYTDNFVEIWIIVHWTSINISREHVASIFRIE